MRCCSCYSLAAPAAVTATTTLACHAYILTLLCPLCPLCPHPIYPLLGALVINGCHSAVVALRKEQKFAMFTHMAGVLCFFVSTCSMAWFRFGGDQAQILTAVLVVSVSLSVYFHHRIMDRFRVDWAPMTSMKDQDISVLKDQEFGVEEDVGSSTASPVSSSTPAKRQSKVSSGPNAKLSARAMEIYDRTE